MKFQLGRRRAASVGSSGGETVNPKFISPLPPLPNKVSQIPNEPASPKTRERILSAPATKSPTKERPSSARPALAGPGMRASTAGDVNWSSFAGGAKEGADAADDGEYTVIAQCFVFFISNTCDLTA